MYVQAQCMVRWPETPWGWRPAEQWAGRSNDDGLTLVIRRDDTGDVCGAHIVPSLAEVVPPITLSITIGSQSATEELYGRASAIDGLCWWSTRAKTGAGDSSWWRLYRVTPREGTAVWVLHHGAQVPEGCMPHERTWTDEDHVAHWAGDEYWTLGDASFPEIGDPAVTMDPHGSARENGYAAAISADWTLVWDRTFTGTFKDVAGTYEDPQGIEDPRSFGTPTWRNGSGETQTTIQASLDREEDTGHYYYTGDLVAGYDQARGVWRTAGAGTWWQTASDPEQSIGQSVTFTKMVNEQAVETRTYVADTHDGLSVENPVDQDEAWLGRIALWR